VPHRPRHDVESFFWVWVWCLLRHAPCLTFNDVPIGTSTQRLDAFNSVFNYKNRLFDAFFAKHDLVLGQSFLTSNVDPLTSASIEITHYLDNGAHSMNSAFRCLRLQIALSKPPPQGSEWENLKAKAISSAPNHRTFLELFDKYLLKPGWPGDEVAVPFRAGVITPQPSSSSVALAGGSIACKFPSSHHSSRKRPRDPLSEI
jgi:hypothetical protein